MIRGMALIPPFFLDAVVAIGAKNEKGEITWIGTGFFIGRPTDENPNKYWIYLVTNKHVLKDQKKIYLRFNPQSNENAREFEIDLIDNANIVTWTGHPVEETDVAVIMINFELLRAAQMQCAFFYSDKNAMTKKQMIELGISEGDFIFVLGFPMNLVDKNRKYVITRLGVIARIKNYLEGFSNDFLVDSAVFPGNSGGPVINKVEFVAIENTKAINKSYLIGMVQSYITYRDVAISLQTKEMRSISVENSGLASVIPTDYILETIEIAHSKKNEPK